MLEVSVQPRLILKQEVIEIYFSLTFDSYFNIRSLYTPTHVFLAELADSFLFDTLCQLLLML